MTYFYDYWLQSSDIAWEHARCTLQLCSFVLCSGGQRQTGARRQIVHVANRFSVGFPYVNEFKI